MNTETLMEKLALKELVDTFSNLADIKDTKTQAQLFVENATLTSHNGDQVFKQEGREAIEEACAAFLALFDTVYHLNGQQVVQIDGDKATGTAYCQVVLIGANEKGKQAQTTQGVRYEDEYVKVDGQWKIANRTSHFIYTDVKEI
ncbi:nuclear transport factor 2 family protein [Streptococcus sp. S784/96/1]|uniref:nuclear transport factor 2 family protein n=1 Tax=Streptococcus sp. S784/96/1 TaxID=2653499 RepID=UPI00138A635C|nr:nuclear transport factor 2 family protein [Streptococcus sp. S784/96/1]